MKVCLRIQRTSRRTHPNLPPNSFHLFGEVQASNSCFEVHIKNVSTLQFIIWYFVILSIYYISSFNTVLCIYTQVSRAPYLATQGSCFAENHGNHMIWVPSMSPHHLSLISCGWYKNYLWILNYWVEKWKLVNWWNVIWWISESGIVFEQTIRDWSLWTRMSLNLYFCQAVL